MSSEQEQPKAEFIEVWEVTLSPSWTGKLIEALAKAQLEFKPVLKQTDNAAFMRGGRASKYADLAEYIDATQTALAKNGLVVTQWPDVSPEAKSMSLVSFLMHSSGEWMRGKLTLPAIGRDGFTAQSCGSSITYARRYSYSAITGCASEDDDGNSASGRGTAVEAQATGARKAKAGQDRLEHAKVVDTLFYTLPESHNGHFAEFLNLEAFGSALNEVQKDGLNLIFKGTGIKKTAGGGALLAVEKLDGVLKELSEASVQVKKLEAA